MKVNQAAHIVNLYPNTEVSKAVTERIQAVCFEFLYNDCISFYDFLH